MPIVHLDNLGSGGINRDLEPYSLPPEVWSDGKNVRFLNNRVQKMLGSEEIYPTWNLGAGFTNPLWLQPWNDDGTIRWLAPMQSKIVVIDASAAQDVTRASGNYNATSTSIWSGMVLGGVPILNNDSGVDPPQSWNSTSNQFEDLPNWPSNTYCAIMRAYKQYAVAFDITASGARSPHLVKWSNPALPGTVPTKWDNASNNDSNEVPLSEGGGFIVDAEPLRDFLVVYKETMTYLMQLTSGAQVFNFRKVFSESGILAPRCAKPLAGKLSGKHFVVTKGDVIVHNGLQAVSVIDRVNRNWLFNNLEPSKIRQTFVAPNYVNNEMWICFITNGVNGTYADTALIWNWETNTWGIRDLPDVAHIGWGLLDKSSKSTVIDDQSQVIDSDTSYIDGAPFAAGQQRMLAAGSQAANDKVFELDVTNQEQGANMSAYVERTGLAVAGRDRQGNPIVDPSSTKFVKRVYPKIEATGPVNLYIGSQTRLEGPVNYQGPFPFNPETDNHVDVRVQGKALAYKIESTTDVSWSTTGFAADMEIIGGSNR